MSRRININVYANEIQPLIADLEWMLANETNAEKNQLRKQLIARLQRQQVAQEVLRTIRSELED